MFLGHNSVGESGGKPPVPKLSDYLEINTKESGTNVADDLA
jgi:hypothetical protein